jgi:hypothetical protein
MKSRLLNRHWPPPKVLFLVRFAALLMCHDEEAPVKPYDGLYVGTDTLGDDDDCVHVGRGGRPDRGPSHLLRKKASSVLSSSSVGLVEDAFSASSVTTRSAHSMSPSDASSVIVIVTESDYVKCAFSLLVLRAYFLLASGVTLLLLNLVILRLPRVGLRPCAAHRRLQHRHQGRLQCVARSSMSTRIFSTLAFSVIFPCCTCGSAQSPHVLFW